MATATTEKKQDQDLRAMLKPGVLGGDYGQNIVDAGKEFNLDPRLIAAVIEIESGGDPKAQSAVGAKGLMQLMDATAESLGVADSFNP